MHFNLALYGRSMASLLDLITPDSNGDRMLRATFVVLLLVWNVLVSTHMETPYPSLLIELYATPLTRIFLLGLVVLSAIWCPTVGVMAALAYISLGADTLFFTAGSAN